MKVHCNEGVATRIDPEPCVFGREGKDEASVRECIGQPWSRESLIILGADAVTSAEGNMAEALSRAFVWPGVVKDPGMCGRSLHGNREISGLTCGGTPQARIGKARSRSR